MVAYLALFVALGGTGAYAANTVFSTDIVDGEVKNPDIGANAIGPAKVADNSLSGTEFKNDSVGPRVVTQLTGTDIVDGEVKNPDLGANAVGPFKIADAPSGSDNVNADMLDGLDSSAFTRPACGSMSGAVKGFARIAASGSFSTDFTTGGVEFAYNCSGGTVEARRFSILGVFHVRFNGNGARLAVVTPESRLESQAAAYWVNSDGGYFVVTNLHNDGTTYSPFTILLV